MEYINAEITDTKLGCLHDRGVMTFWIMLDYGGSGQGFGGYTLDSYDKNLNKRVQTELTGEIVHGILSALDVDSWENLKGKYVRVIVDNIGFSQNIKGIGHIIKDKFFIIEDVFTKYKENHDNT